MKEHREILNRIDRALENIEEVGDKVIDNWEVLKEEVKTQLTISLDLLGNVKVILRGESH